MRLENRVASESDKKRVWSDRILLEKGSGRCERRSSIAALGRAPRLSTIDCRLSTALLVREEGFEPSRAFAHGILSPARLPVPPLSRSRHRRSNRMTIQRRAVTVAVMSKTVDCLRIAAV